MKDVMIDIETLGTRSTSMIVQIGACYFDRKTGKIGPKFRQNISSGFDDRFTIDASTISWWLSQSDEARASIAKDGKDLTTILTNLRDWLGEAKFVWSHATFDIPILLNAFEKCDLHFPIHYTKMRDIRTLMDIANIDTKSLKREGTHHDALADCEYQVAYCTKALDSLG